MRRGVTLIELLLSLAIVLTVTLASTHALVIGLQYNSHLSASRGAIVSRMHLEDEIRQLLTSAWLTPSTATPGTTVTTTTAGFTNTGPASFFIGGTPSLLPNAPGLSQTPGQSAPAASSTAGGVTINPDGPGTDTVTFTVAGQRLSSAELASKDDFETNNRNIGPVGGVTEVGISMEPVGTSGQGVSGLFYRVQCPADADPTQGGTEQLLSADVTQINFQFFDGNSWQPSWDSRSQPTPRLPAAVLVSYRLQGDDQDHVFIVQLPNSDVTAQNPATVTG